MSHTDFKPFRAGIFGGSEDAQALQELALVAFIFVVLMLGAAELGRVAYFNIEVGNAARAGVQYGSQSHITASDFAGMRTAATNDAPDVSSLSGWSTPVATNFCSCSDGSYTNVTCSTITCSSSRIIEYVKVTTSASIPGLFNYPGLSGTITLGGLAVMRVEQ